MSEQDELWQIHPRNEKGVLLLSLSPKTQLGEECAREAVENLEIIDTKQRDYGRGNLDAFGSYGVLVRSFDKISRLSTLYGRMDHEKVHHESVEDSWRDLANYALIGLVEHLRETGHLGKGSLNK